MCRIELLGFLRRIIIGSFGNGMSKGIPLGLQDTLELENLVMLPGILKLEVQELGLLLLDLLLQHGDPSGLLI
jgi:hypothetical protein